MSIHSIASTATGTPMPICRRRIVLTVSVRQRSCASCGSSRRRASKKRCSRVLGTSSTSMTRLSRLVASTTSRHRRSKRSSWYVSNSARAPPHILTCPQRSILEADQEEENEEAGDMNDDEINEIIARSDDEERIFREIDIQRDREALDKWRAAGNRGKPPQSLIQLEELPDCYKSDEPFESKDELDELEGRGHRRRAVVNYTDGLSDDQWAMVRFFDPFPAVSSVDHFFLRLWRRARISRSSRSARGRGRRVALRTSSYATWTQAALRWRRRRVGGRTGKARAGRTATRRLLAVSGNGARRLRLSRRPSRRTMRKSGIP